MKVAVFISIFLTVFASAGYYVYTRTTQSFFGGSDVPIYFLVTYIFLLSSFLIGKIIENASIGFISDALIRIGSLGVGFFIYAFLIIVFIDFIRLINYIVPFYPDFFTADIQKSKLIVGIVSLSIITILFFVGYINAKTIRVKKLDITIDKQIEDLNIVAVSDIHLGTMVNKSKAQRLVKTIKELDPDIVFIGGDIIDDNIEVVKHFKLLEYFKELSPKYGVYSCLGNHEYISRAFNQLDEFEKNGIHMLKDTSLLVDNKFYIIGRDDLQGKMMGHSERKSLNELTKDINFDLPVFLLDHQPYKLDEVAKYPIDFQFSGHTHSGQIWPFKYITHMIFEKDWGYIMKNNTHFYISSGYGTSMMPIRVGTHSEVINIKISTFR